MDAKQTTEQTTMNSIKPNRPTNVIYRGKVYRILESAPLGFPHLVKLASNFSLGSPFTARRSDVRMIG